MFTKRFILRWTALWLDTLRDKTPLIKPADSNGTWRNSKQLPVFIWRSVKVPCFHDRWALIRTYLTVHPPCLHVKHICYSLFPVYIIFQSHQNSKLLILKSMWYLFEFLSACTVCCLHGISTNSTTVTNLLFIVFPHCILHYCGRLPASRSSAWQSEP